MEVEEILRRLDGYVSHLLTYYASKSYESYRNVRPSYMLGRFEAAYQVAYGIIEERTIQDAIDAAHEDMTFYYAQLEKDLPALWRSYYKGLIGGYKIIIVYLGRLKYEYESTTDYPLRHLWSEVGFENLADAVNIY